MYLTSYAGEGLFRKGLISLQVTQGLAITYLLREGGGAV
jgi:hypothetical protein